jgi:hypothetical protein
VIQCSITINIEEKKKEIFSICLNFFHLIHTHLLNLIINDTQFSRKKYTNKRREMEIQFSLVAFHPELFSLFFCSLNAIDSQVATEDFKLEAIE